MARPIPCWAPVTSATFPVSRIVVLLDFPSASVLGSRRELTPEGANGQRRRSRAEHRFADSRRGPRHRLHRGHQGCPQRRRPLTGPAPPAASRSLAMARYDTAVLNGTVVVPYVGMLRCDVGVRAGRIAALVDSIPSSDADTVVDARGRLVLPGAVDSHFHIGIYRDLATDARSETASALAGGVTTVVSYFRTGQNYLNKSGPYRTIFPEVVAATVGHAHTDFGYHIGVMTTEQLGEVDWLVGEQGVGSFKYYMFYKGLNLTSDSTRGSAYTMADTYDLGHLYLLMRQVAAASEKYGAHGRISLSLHCEQAELIRVFIEEVKRSGPGGLEGYHRSRPPLTEQLSIAEALVLTDATRCPVNLLHLSSAEAVASGADGRQRHPHLDIRLETTLHHLALTHATAGGIVGKVNPPIRTEADREALWQAVADGRIDTVVSDHACCAETDKQELWRALPGFGGTALLYSYLFSEGHLRREL